MNLEDQVVLITGAREGIGAACAREFIKRGARVSLVDVAAESNAVSGDVCWTRGDITDKTVRREAVHRTLTKFGRIDVLVNNAGIGLYASPSESADWHVERLFDVNVFASVALTKPVLPHMRQRQAGAIVNIESIGALVSLPWCAMYCATKHALHAFTKSLRHEVSGDGIHVMSVMPGIVDTEFRKHVLSGTPPAGVAEIRRVISPEHLAVSIANGLEKKKTTVIDPPIGYLFSAVDLFLPGLMRWYLKSRWTRQNASVSK